MVGESREGLQPRGQEEARNNLALACERLFSGKVEDGQLRDEVRTTLNVALKAAQLEDGEALGDQEQKILRIQAALGVADGSGSDIDAFSAVISDLAVKASDADYLDNTRRLNARWRPDKPQGLIRKQKREIHHFAGDDRVRIERIASQIVTEAEKGW